MEIRFNPLIRAEAEAVRKFLDDGESMTLRIPAAEIGKAIAEIDRPDTGAEVVTIPAPPVSAVPLPPAAPSPAAADLFSTAPVAQQDGAASATPVPAPPVPSAAAPDAPEAPAEPTNHAELDKNGLPWDARIHSGTKARNADGSWRQRRGLNDPALIARVEGELRALIALPSAAPLAGAATAPSAPAVEAAPTSPPPVPAPPVPVPVASVSPEVPAPNVPPAPVPSPPATAPTPTPPAATVAPVPGPGAATITFAQLMQKVTQGVAQGKTTQQRVNEHVATVGCTSIAQLATRLDLAAAVAALLDGDQL